MYDYSARYYDGALGRFTTVDPLAEKYYSWSPYAYCANNPIKFIDPTGMVIDSAYIDQWNNEKAAIFSQWAALISNNANGVNNERIGNLYSSISAMIAAEASTQLYRLGDSTGNLGGGVIYDPKSGLWSLTIMALPILYMS